MSSIAGWWKKQLGNERLSYLQSLPNSYDFWLSGKRVRLFHASQVNEHHRVLAYAAPKTHLEMFTNTAFTGYANPEPDIVGYGDIHVNFVVSPAVNKILFNAGSVGNSGDLPMATYMIMTGCLDSQEVSPFNIETVRLPYDIEAAIARAVERRMPEIKGYAQELRTAVYRGYRGE